ncbi:MAG: DUF4156 domain-containing protein [Bdellovibrionota bacterium]
MKRVNSWFALLGLLVFSALLWTACSSQPIVPEGKNVKISRDNPDEDCREIGKVQGSVKTAVGTIEQAIEDMKLDAARKGANYVRMEATSALGTSASGTAYQCP